MNKAFETANLLKDFILVEDRSIEPIEILDLREEPITPNEIDIWNKCIGQSLYVLGVRERNTERLVGIAMVAGNQRHAELVDATVHTDVRQRGIGRMMMERLVDYVREENIKYVSLTYDKTKPWLKDGYSQHGFESINFAMWHKDSLDS